MEWIPLLMFVVVCLVLLSGYPVAFVLGGTALLFAAAGLAFAFDEPVFFVNVPAGEQHGNEQNEYAEQNVPPPDAEPVGKGFKTPHEEFQNSSESDFHKRC